MLAYYVPFAQLPPLDLNVYWEIHPCQPRSDHPPVGVMGVIGVIGVIGVMGVIGVIGVMGVIGLIGGIEPLTG